MWHCVPVSGDSSWLGGPDYSSLFHLQHTNHQDFDDNEEKEKSTKIIILTENVCFSFNEVLISDKKFQTFGYLAFFGCPPLPLVCTATKLHNFIRRECGLNHFWRLDPAGKDVACGCMGCQPHSMESKMVREWKWKMGCQALPKPLKIRVGRKGEEASKGADLFQKGGQTKKQAAGRGTSRYSIGIKSWPELISN